MKKVRLHLGDRSYSVLIGRGLLNSLGRFLKPLRLGSKVLVVSNKKVSPRFLAPIQVSLKRAGFDVVKPYCFRHANERDKSGRALLGLWEHMAAQGLERSSTVLTLGGGVVGDVAGFAASTYMRGISVVEVPTTLLAQVDAAIGGKTAIDLPVAKNMVGTFYQPRLVVADVATLRVLTKFRAQELRNGLAEVIKYGMIQDAVLFELLEKRSRRLARILEKGSLDESDLSFFETVVWRSARVKACVVEEDERETKGKRMILNYGHTFGHAFEAASNYRLPHGEAVALGMVAAAHLARKKGMLGVTEERRQHDLLYALGFTTQLGGLRLTLEGIKRAMFLDKKKREGRIRFVLPERIGRVRVVDNVSMAEVNKTLKDLGGS